MSISAVGDASATSFDQTYSVTVAKKSLDAREVDGRNALTLIDSAASVAPAAAPLVKPGHSLSVMA